ncbi:AAA family ATPase [Thermomonas sp. XSG]|uniref:AAA family ATPase n=1 Tax=Thermomonas sp. XSG TaxID=2771436 RepID=UPI0016810C35|nr:AAA family ATPase [Thermomonas sp. XSG]QNU16013.1 AAA family ATPase [Thermomonas sp. XSG]
MASAQEQRKVITFDRFDRLKPAKMTAVIDGFLYADTLTNVIGKSGACKSFLLQGMAACVATGTHWMGRRVERGAVFYIGGEGLNGLLKRFRGWQNYTGVTLEGAPLYIASGLPPLSDQLNVAATIEAIQECAEESFFRMGGADPALIVIDTLARALGGADENSAAEVGRLIEGLDWIRQRWGCAVACAHHTGHGENTQNRGRGSSAIYAALDGELLVTSNGDDVTVTSTKVKDWTKPEPLVLTRNIVAVEVEDTIETTLVLDKASIQDLAAHDDLIRQQVLERKGAGKTVRAIAADLGVSRWKVQSITDKARQANDYRRQADGE